MSVRVEWVGSPKYTLGHPAPYSHIVNHRMVGTLVGTDAAFTSTGGRSASTTFGIGTCRRHSRNVCIHQYVRLGDQHWGNANWDASGGYNDHFPTTHLNSRTVSIEHEDNGGASGTDHQGIVSVPIQDASIALQRLLLRGDIAEMTGAGIRFRDGMLAKVARELGSIPVDAQHIVDHNYIAGRLKPYCWKPWADDKVGFPQDRYLAGLKEDDVAGLRLTTTGVIEHGTLSMKDGTEVIRVSDRLRIAIPANAVRPADGLVRSLDLNLDGYLVYGLVVAEYEPVWVRTSDTVFFTASKVTADPDLQKTADDLRAALTAMGNKVAAAKAALG